MFVNYMADDRSASTIEGDIESKRGLLAKLHHAAYCQHDGYTVDTHCLSDPLCCASKRLFEHMSTCIESYCGVPCCKGSRRVWRHYRKCRHVKACPLCSVVTAAYTPVGLSPRFLKLSSSVSNGSQSTSNSNRAAAPTPSASYSPGGHKTSTTLNTTFEEETDISTGAIVTPSKNMQRRQVQQTQLDGKENNENSTSAAVSSARAVGEHSVEIPWEQFRKQQQNNHIPVPPSVPPPPPPPPPLPGKTRTSKLQAAKQHSRSLSFPIQYTTRRADSGNDSSAVLYKNKPPLSPRRPNWALF